MVAVFDNRNIDIKDVAITQYRRTLDLTKISIFTGRNAVADNVLIDVQIDFGKP